MAVPLPEEREPGCSLPAPAPGSGKLLHAHHASCPLSSSSEPCKSGMRSRARERGGCWSSLPALLGNSVHGELSPRRSGFPPALPSAGWRPVTCWPVPSGTSPLHHFLQAGNVTCKQSGKAGAGLGSHAPCAPGPAPAPAGRPRAPKPLPGLARGAGMGLGTGSGSGGRKAAEDGEMVIQGRAEAVGKAVTRLLCALALL